MKIDYPDDYRIYQNLGITYGNMGDIDKSVENMMKAISIHPTPLAFYNLAVALRKAGNLKEAIHYLKLYLENAKGVDEATMRKAREELSAWENMLRQ